MFNRVKSLNVELNPICHLLALLGAHHILHVSRIRVNSSCQRLEYEYSVPDLLRRLQCSLYVTQKAVLLYCHSLDTSVSRLGMQVHQRVPLR